MATRPKLIPLLAYFSVWMVGGEPEDAYGPWSGLTRYLKETDPYGRTT